MKLARARIKGLEDVNPPMCHTENPQVGAEIVIDVHQLITIDNLMCDKCGMIYDYPIKAVFVLNPPPGREHWILIDALDIDEGVYVV